MNKLFILKLKLIVLLTLFSCSEIQIENKKNFKYINSPASEAENFRKSLSYLPENLKSLIFNQGDQLKPGFEIGHDQGSYYLQIPQSDEQKALYKFKLKLNLLCQTFAVEQFSYFLKDLIGSAVFFFDPESKARFLEISNKVMILLNSVPRASSLENVYTKLQNKVNNGLRENRVYLDLVEILGYSQELNSLEERFIYFPLGLLQEMKGQANYVSLLMGNEREGQKILNPSDNPMVLQRLAYFFFYEKGKISEGIATEGFIKSTKALIEFLYDVVNKSNKKEDYSQTKLKLEEILRKIGRINESGLSSSTAPQSTPVNQGKEETNQRQEEGALDKLDKIKRSILIPEMSLYIDESGNLSQFLDGKYYDIGMQLFNNKLLVDKAGNIYHYEGGSYIGGGRWKDGEGIICELLDKKFVGVGKLLDRSLNLIYLYKDNRVFQFKGDRWVDKEMTFDKGFFKKDSDGKNYFYIGNEDWYLPYKYN